MKNFRILLALVPALVLPACGEGQSASDVVHAAAQGAAEAGQKLADKASEITGVSAEEAKQKLQEFVDLAARELREVRDSESARRLAEEIQGLLEQLGVFARKMGETLHVGGLMESLEDLIERFQSDPRVTEALKRLHEKIESLSR